MAGFLLLPPFLSPHRGKCPLPSVKSNYRKRFFGVFISALVVLCSLLVQGKNSAQAADRSGKLWVERPQAAPKTPRHRTRTPQGRPRKRDRASPQVFQPVKNTQQTINGRANGVQRQTLPPVQNAPVDEQYGNAGSGRDQRILRPQNQRIVLPTGLWQGMRFERFRDGLLALDGSGGSLALNNLVASALLDRRSLPQNTDPQTVDLLKMVVFYRMGRIERSGPFHRHHTSQRAILVGARF